jgi:hypothetical protein
VALATPELSILIDFCVSFRRRTIRRRTTLATNPAAKYVSTPGKKIGAKHSPAKNYPAKNLPARGHLSKNFIISSNTSSKVLLFWLNQSQANF